MTQRSSVTFEGVNREAGGLARKAPGVTQRSWVTFEGVNREAGGLARKALGVTKGQVRPLVSEPLLPDGWRAGEAAVPRRNG